MINIRKIARVVTLSLLTMSALPLSAQRYAGGDISALKICEDARAQYKNQNSSPIQDVITFSQEQGMNAMRVRIFVNPKRYQQDFANSSVADLKYDPNACQDLETVIPICRRIVNSGMKLMIDFHYSDTWADPGKQWTPIEWAALNDDQLAARIHDYTVDCLARLKKEGATPSFVQIGNEISYGMCWGAPGTTSPKKTFVGQEANWNRLGKLLSAGIAATRSEVPDAKIIIHTERIADTYVLRGFYDRMKNLGIDYDIIGLSYYPYFHKDLDGVRNALKLLSDNYPSKKIMIVEVGYPYKWAIPGTTYDYSSKWPYSDSGQNQFAKDFIATVNEFDNCIGIFWWWMEYNAFGTSLSNWYNAPLFDSTTGRVTSAFSTIARYASSSDVPTISAPSAEKNRYFNLMGVEVKKPSSGIFIHNGRKILLP